MLVSFWVENFKCFKDGTTFSMEATKLKNLKEDNTFSVNTISLLKSAVIYGPNASGKSSILQAMKKMKNIVIFSLLLGKEKKYQANPYLLNSSSSSKDTSFEIEFIIDEILYRYGFSIATNSVITKEYLFQKKLQSKAREVKLFTRDNSNFTLGAQFKEGKNLFDKTRENALFLSVVAQFNGKISNSIIEWFEQFNILNNIKSKDFEHISFDMLEDELIKEKVIHFIKKADLGIYDIVKKRLSFDDLKKDNPNIEKNLPDFIIDSIKEKGINAIETSHIKYNEQQEFESFENFNISLESDGTQKLLALSGPVLDSLINGKILVIDELDNSLHTELVKAIVELFNSKESNPNNAQLIFTTHDTNLLNQNLFRRDQIWFSQKNIFGECELYSLVEYGKGKTRNDLDLEKNYLEGKFGAIPHINTLYEE